MKSIFVALLTLGLIASSSLRAADDAALREEVSKFMEDYSNLFMAGRAETIADQVYLTPFVIISDAGPTAYTSRQQIREYLEVTFKTLRADGYARTDWQQRTIKILSPTAAIFSGTYTRYRSNGSKIATLAATYTLTKIAGSWRIVVLSRHAPEKTLR